MSRRIGPKILVVFAVSVAAGVLVASEVGHIAEIQLTPAGAAPSDGTDTINLSYDLGPNIANVKDLMDNIGFANVRNVSRYFKASNSFESYSVR